MSTPKGNGLDAANDQPAKTLTKSTSDFTAPSRFTGTERKQTTHTINEAPAMATRGRDGIWTWTVIDCPYCHRRHHHGGGNGDSPELLGHRVAHCVADGGAVYIMVEVPQ